MSQKHRNHMAGQIICSNITTIGNEDISWGSWKQIVLVGTLMWQQNPSWYHKSFLNMVPVGNFWQNQGLPLFAPSWPLFPCMLSFKYLNYMVMLSDHDWGRMLHILGFSCRELHTHKLWELEESSFGRNWDPEGESDLLKSILLFTPVELGLTSKRWASTLGYRESHCQSRTEIVLVE